MNIQNILDKHLIINHLYVNPYYTHNGACKYKEYEEMVVASPLNGKKFTIRDHLIWIPLFKLHYGLTKKYEFITESLEGAGFMQEQYRCILGTIKTELD